MTGPDDPWEPHPAFPGPQKQITENNSQETA